MKKEAADTLREAIEVLSAIPPSDALPRPPAAERLGKRDLDLISTLVSCAVEALGRVTGGQDVPAVEVANAITAALRARRR